MRTNIQLFFLYMKFAYFTPVYKKTASFKKRFSKIMSFNYFLK